MWLITCRIVYFSFNSDTQIPRDLLVSKNLRPFTLCKTQLLKVSRNLKCHSITKTLFPIKKKKTKILLPKSINKFKIRYIIYFN